MFYKIWFAISFTLMFIGFNMMFVDVWDEFERILLSLIATFGVLAFILVVLGVQV